MDNKSFQNLESYLIFLQAHGKHAFTLEQIRKEFASMSNTAIKSGLVRLVKKEMITSIHKGYYLIIPPQYRSKGILPPFIFLDEFMHTLKKPYYVALLSAASFHGAAHHQPQEVFVMTTFPVLRPLHKKGIKINFISKKEIDLTNIEKRKTETGYLNISNSFHTAIDLIQFAKRVGGLNRVAVILEELMDQISINSIHPSLLKNTPMATIQRLGYVLEKILLKVDWADQLYLFLHKQGTELYRVPLDALGLKKDFPTDERWKVILNTKIELEQ